MQMHVWFLFLLKVISSLCGGHLVNHTLEHLLMQIKHNPVQDFASTKPFGHPINEASLILLINQ